MARLYKKGRRGSKPLRTHLQARAPSPCGDKVYFCGSTTTPPTQTTAAPTHRRRTRLREGGLREPRPTTATPHRHHQLNLTSKPNQLPHVPWSGTRVGRLVRPAQPTKKHGGCLLGGGRGRGGEPRAEKGGWERAPHRGGGQSVPANPGAPGSRGKTPRGDYYYYYYYFYYYSYSYYYYYFYYLHLPTMYYALCTTTRLLLLLLRLLLLLLIRLRRLRLRLL